MPDCLVCVHPHRESIDQALLAKGANKSHLAEEFDISRFSLTNHQKRHLSGHTNGSHVVVQGSSIEEIESLIAEKVRERTEAIEETIVTRLRSGLEAIITDEVSRQVQGAAAQEAKSLISASPEVVARARALYDDAKMLRGDAALRGVIMNISALLVHLLGPASDN